ncbi:transient receptor potential cation channel protein painless-like [Ochlerotatus camptorhynchus]|uniref:transient receptor potential cation channel protein painless-like n=1 Tax=Ochlerotatus camptorhynchus TaxID=644619 RepID=UPI0031D2F8F1
MHNSDTEYKFVEQLKANELYAEPREFVLSNELRPGIQALATSLDEGNFKKFQCALNKGANPNGRNDHTGFTVFEEVCKRSGSAQFISECLKNDADGQMQNDNGMFPIHFATSSRDPNNIRALLNNLMIDIDETYQNRTPLHMLFEKIDDSNWKNDFECIKVLLEKGADFNIPNAENRTPLGVFVISSKNWKTNSEFWRKEILEYCLKNARVDVDKSRNEELRKKIDEYFPDTEIPSYTMEINRDVLKSPLKPDRDAKFDVDVKLYKDKHKNDKRAWEQEMRELVKTAVKSGTLASVKKLVEDGSVPDSALELSALLGTCCSYGNCDILEYLLSKLGNTENDIEQINKQPLLSLAIKEMKISKNKGNCPFVQCVKCLLADKRIKVDTADSKGFSALHFAVKYKFDEVVDLLLEHSAYIGKQNMFKEMPICDISPETLETFLDSRLTTNEKRPEDDDYEIKIDFSGLVPPKSEQNSEPTITVNRSADEMLPIVYMSKSSDLKHLLKHPVISSFVLIKWQQLIRYFYFNFLICTLLFISLTWYVVGWSRPDAVDGYLKKLLFWTALICTTYMLVREILQMILYKMMYLKSMANWTEMALILTSAAFLLGFLKNEVISAVVILLSAVEFTVLVGTLPILSISTHMVMLKTVSKNFIKCIVLYCAILISFAMCFYTSFNVSTLENNQNKTNTNSSAKIDNSSKFNQFADIGTSLLKTLVMLTGEFGAADITFDSNSSRYLIFVLFIFFVPIVIFNLINGLAVSDIVAIKAEAELIGLSQKVDVIYQTYLFENALKTLDIIGYLSRNMLHIVKITPNTSNEIHSSVSSNNDDVEGSHKKKLPFRCCSLPSVYRMDGKILKYAKEILSKRNRKSKSMELRLTEIERGVQAILAHLK